MRRNPRHEIVADDELGIYHCISRCVRRAFLCGVDPVTGINHDHRKEWIRARLQQLASVFAIEVCGYAVLSNHFHVVLRVRPDLTQEWSDEEVAIRWRLLLDWTGRELRAGARGTIPARLSPILQRLGLNGDCWLETVSNFGRWFKRAAGGRISLAAAAMRSGRRWFQGQRFAKTAFV